MVGKVLVIGGGIAGMSAAILLRRSGAAVDLVEMDPAWRVYGAGITITGPTLRALRAVGVLDAVLAQGAAWSGGTVFSKAGEFIADLSTTPVEEGIPATGGVMRPVLHAVLSETTRAVGVDVRLGVTVEALHQVGEAVEVATSDGEQRTYDLVIGADGIFSATRKAIFPEAPEPRFTGQACWRLLAERPPGFDRSHFYMGGDRKIGFNPVSPTHMYMFLLEHTPDDPWIELADQPARLHALMEGFGGIVPGIREGVLANPTINYRPLKILLQPPPWNVGRVVLIGDAVHATTPHLASGAGMAVEDAVVLAEELGRGGEVEAALERFTGRRFDRCRMVVENSVRLGELEMTGGSPQEHNTLMAASITALRQAI